MTTSKRKKKPVPAPPAKKREMKFGSLQVAWLVAFVESAEHKRTAAAATLGVTQSTVTKYIDSLDSWYGGGPRRLLMLSNVHPPILTEDGKKFLPKAQELLKLIRAAQPSPLKTDEAATRPSTAHIRVPPPVAPVKQGDGTTTEAGRDRPLSPRALTPGESSSPDDNAPSENVRDLSV